MKDDRSGSLKPDTPELRHALSYWQGKCSNRPMPRRAGIDPEMRSWLFGTFLAEVYFDAGAGHPADIHFGVAGTQVGDLYGMQLTNRKLSKVDIDGFRYQGFANYRDAIEQRQPTTRPPTASASQTPDPRGAAPRLRTRAQSGCTVTLPGQSRCRDSHAASTALKVTRSASSRTSSSPPMRRAISRLK